MSVDGRLDVELMCTSFRHIKKKVYRRCPGVENKELCGGKPSPPVCYFLISGHMFKLIPWPLNDRQQKQCFSFISYGLILV